MSINVSFHSNEQYEGPLHVHSHVTIVNGHNSAYVKMRKAEGEVTLFFDNVKDIERMAFEFSTLVMAARDEWGTGTREES